MSLEREETLKCPSCGAENSFRIYDSINVTLNPELKEKVLDGSLFKLKCRKCGAETVVRYDTLYHDMSADHPLLIQCCQKREGWDKINEQNENIRTMMREMNLSSEFPHRVVIGYNALREAIRIFDAGYDDRILFAVKTAFAAMLKRDHKECRGILFCTKDENGHPVFSVLDNEHHEQFYTLDPEIYQNIAGKLGPLLPRESEKHILVDDAFMRPFIEQVRE